MITDVRQAAWPRDAERLDVGPVHPDWRGQPRTSFHHNCWSRGRRRGNLWGMSRLIIGFCPANERCCDKVTPSLIRLAQTCIKLMHHFVAIGEFKLELQSGNGQLRQNRRFFFSRVTLQFDLWPWKTIGHLFYYTWWIQTWVTVRKRPNWFKFDDIF